MNKGKKSDDDPWVSKMLEAMVAYPCLYDKGHEDYRSSTAKKSAWEEIVEEIDASIGIRKSGKVILFLMRWP